MSTPTISLVESSDIIDGAFCLLLLALISCTEEILAADAPVLFVLLSYSFVCEEDWLLQLKP